VLEHHSNLTPDEQTWRAKILSENWDAPVIYTTSVQLLETLFGAGTRGARRMHQLANAVIVLDEAQTRPSVAAFTCSTTRSISWSSIAAAVSSCARPPSPCSTWGQPAQKGAARFQSEGRDCSRCSSALFAALEARPGPRPTSRRGAGRTMRSRPSPLSEIERYAGSCLVIVNTRQGGAQRSTRPVQQWLDSAIFSTLSTRMCPAHRRQVSWPRSAERLADGHPPRLCISTQLIEAGVDVDFGARLSGTSPAWTRLPRRPGAAIETGGAP
jgi:CRISPR-associated endonuclease/helicase Cas3